jgi:hypothetical protein
MMALALLLARAAALAARRPMMALARLVARRGGR